MKIKRAFYATLVLLLLPLTVMAQAPTPALGTAVIAVSKFFDSEAQGYDAGMPVTVNIQCDGGSIGGDSKVNVFPEFGKYQTSFVVFNLGPGQTTECHIWEDPIDGYTAEYYCGYGTPDAGPDDSCAFSEDGPSAIDCQFNTIVRNDVDGGMPTPGSQAYCDIFNEVDPVEIEVTKEWEVFGQPGNNFSEGATIRIRCNAPIYNYNNKNGQWYGKHFRIGNNDYVDGIASVTAEVFPEWYPDDETTMCYAVEDNVASAVEVDSDCGSQQLPAMSVPIGSSGVGCTITNTMFFEGIPTLNQYGMAIMALLMLGVGFVGFRRFV